MTNFALTILVITSIQNNDPKSLSSLPVTIMFYNVENLFYPEDDPLTRDDEFSPEGSMHWTWTRYHKKITAVVKVILAAGAGHPPIVIGLCEIENESVLLDIINHPLLMKYEYRIIHRDGPDPRGIDVALLYRDGFFPLTYSFYSIEFPGTDDQTREFLHVPGITKQGDSLDILVNHWTSRYGDVVGTASKRLFQANTLKKIRDSLFLCRTDPLIIAIGDFNDGSESDPVKMFSGFKNTFIAEDHFDNAEINGTYKYHGRWETIDHFIITSSREKSQFVKKVFSSPFLIEADERYTGLKPDRTYIGQTYHGGVSDHLPILLTIHDPGHPVH